MIDLDGEEAGQVAIAVGVILALLKLQTENKGAIAVQDLPLHIIEQAQERERQGDRGAARMLCDWADLLRDQNRENGQ